MFQCTGLCFAGAAWRGSPDRAWLDHRDQLCIQTVSGLHRRLPACWRMVNCTQYCNRLVLARPALVHCFSATARRTVNLGIEFSTRSLCRMARFTPENAESYLLQLAGVLPSAPAASRQSADIKYCIEQCSSATLCSVSAETCLQLLPCRLHSRL